MSKREKAPGSRLQAPGPDAPEMVKRAHGYWTSLEELHLSADARADLDRERDAREFPDGASEAPADDVSRRGFLTLMGASIAMATMTGCRRPVEHVVPYARLPENLVPGVPQHYATVMDRDGEALGLIVEAHEGRPTKIEGNPEHTGSMGGADMIAQASVLDLYDPDRSRQPHEGAHARTWNEFDHAFDALIEAQSANGGEGLHFLCEPTISPTFLRLRELISQRLPHARFHTYAAVRDNARAGTELAFGAPVNVLPAFDRARVVVSLDSDFLLTEPGMVRATRSYADARRLHTVTDEMLRHYQIESVHSTTGANADHRLRLPSRDVEAYAMALAARLASSHGVDLGEVAAAVTGHNAPEGVPAHWIEQVAVELANNRGRSIVLAGRRQPPTVHALAQALNVALGNVGETVVYAHVADPNQPEPSDDLRALAEAMNAHQVQTLIILGGNPVYDAPGDLDFGAKLANVPTSVHLSMFVDETSSRCSWHAPRAHALETWGDAQALDGTLAVQQPLIAPLFAGRSDVEILAGFAGVSSRRGHDQVQETVRGENGTFAGMADMAARQFDRGWRHALHRGVLRGAPVPMTSIAPRSAEIAAQLRARTVGTPIGHDNIEVVFVPDPKVWDGRHANNAWMVELPHPMSRIVWDNAAYVSPRTAQDLSIENGDVLEFHKDGRSVRSVAWIMPGQTDWSIALTLGWGRTAAGRIGNHKGFDVNPLRSSHAMDFVDGVEVRKTGETYRIVQTQEHHRMVGRPIAIEATLDEYRDHPHFAEHVSPTPRTLPLWRGVEYTGHKWGLVIDLNACTGCNACAVACQSENNIPVVGKDQVYRGREMHWLRIDRYFVGDEHDPSTVHQPVMCVQCENAPCENVCPVNATTHSPEGLNDMAYNRCIGTRYCSNNCPYKVRRFNYLNWHNDGPYQPIDPDVPETVQMQHNPNVTVRFRGVMEKCTYCVQRIQSARIAAKRENRPIRDGEIVTACQQTCPAHAIVFGDLNDDRSRVAAWTRNDRGYHLLGEIGTRPRTTHLARVRNPNPEMHG